MGESTKWVVMISVGEYSDTRTWPLLVCNDEAAARRAIDAIEARRQAIIVEIGGRFDHDVYMVPDDVTEPWFREFGTTWDPRLFSTSEEVRFGVIECASGGWPASGEERTDG